MILALYGAGAMGRELKYLADLTGKWTGIVFIDDNAVEEQMLGCPVYRLQAFLMHYRPEDVQFIISMGEPRFRREGFERLKKAGYRGGVLIAPSAHVSDDAKIGEGVAIAQDAFVGSLASIGDNVDISIRATVGHDAVIGAHTRLGVNAFVGGHVKIGESVFIGSMAMIRDRIQVGEQSVVSLGAAVFSDVPAKATMIGNPARIANEKAEETYLFRDSAFQAAQERRQHEPEEGLESASRLGLEQVIIRYWETFSGSFEGIDFNPVTFHFQDEGWDSLSHMLLISRLEEAFSVHFTGREILRMSSFGAGLKTVKKKLGLDSENG